MAEELGMLSLDLRSHHQSVKLLPDADDSSGTTSSSSASAPVAINLSCADGKPLCVIPSLLEQFGIANLHKCMYRKGGLFKRLQSCGVALPSEVLEKLSNCPQTLSNGSPTLSNGGTQGRPLDNVPEDSEEQFRTEPEEWELALGRASVGVVMLPHAYGNGVTDAPHTDLEVVTLILNHLKTPQARRLRFGHLASGLMIMSGRQDVALKLAEYWAAERCRRPEDCLLQFLGAAAAGAMPEEEGAEPGWRQRGSNGGDGDDLPQGNNNDLLELAHKKRMLELAYSSAEKRSRLQEEEAKARMETALAAKEEARAKAEAAGVATEAAAVAAEAEKVRLRDEGDARLRRQRAEEEAEARIREAQAQSGAQREAQLTHEAFRRERADTIIKNAEALKALAALRGELSPRTWRCADDQLRTGIVGEERPDEKLGRPVYLSQYLQEKLKLRAEAAKERAKVFGRLVKKAVVKLHPSYDVDGERTNHCVDGCERDVHLYYEAHLGAIAVAFAQYRSSMAPVKKEELTRIGLEEMVAKAQQRSSGGGLGRFFRTRATRVAAAGAPSASAAETSSAESSSAAQTSSSVGPETTDVE